jgi:hypothetical protein
MTRHLIICLATLLTACGQKDSSKNIIATGTTATSDKTVEHVANPYFIGDISGDKIADTAFVIYDRLIRADSTIEKDCVNKDCEVTIKFTSNIPELIIPQSPGLAIEKIEDLNNDNSNELILFSQTFEGFWDNLYIWTFKNNKWAELARTRALISDDKDFQKRIIKINSNFYLIGDGWDDSKGGVIERSIKN